MKELKSSTSTHTGNKIKIINYPEEVFSKA
jgi:hypothetical protein